MFEALAKLAEKSVPNKEIGQHRATRATETGKPQETVSSRQVKPVAQISVIGQRRKPAENWDFSPSVALVAHVAQKNEQGCKWDENDWRTFYEERAGMLEYDGELDRSQAEAQAWECTVIQWMNQNPPTGIDNDLCAGCGHPIGIIGNDAVPFLAGGGGHAWLHHGCHGAWMP